MSIMLTYFLCKVAMHPKYDLIELFFFAYRDFTRDADDCLERYKFGRAHHRVIHFVHRHPGLTVNELLDILKITKQSFSRVFKDLETQDFITQKEGITDRRQRLLYNEQYSKSYWQNSCIPEFYFHPRLVTALEYFPSPIRCAKSLFHTCQ